MQWWSVANLLITEEGDEESDLVRGGVAGNLTKCFMIIHYWGCASSRFVRSATVKQVSIWMCGSAAGQGKQLCILTVEEGDYINLGWIH